MAPSIYHQLRSDTSHLNIRLIRLQPSEVLSAPLVCELVVYPLAADRSHMYECLSYVWGPRENPATMKVHSPEGYIDVEIRRNLHAALLQLRDPIFERTLWIDAVCINQEDDEERSFQVAAMATIYGLASRVVAWLGEEEDQSGLAFQELTMMALGDNRKHLVSFKDVIIDDREENTSEAVEAVLNREYFRRMWVLQELTAARSLIFRCGRSEMQATTFLSGLVNLPTSYDWRLHNRIQAFIQLVRSSERREYLKGKAHLNIDSLVELVDKFRAHSATDPRDKIYALWGLSSDAPSMEMLQPNYQKSTKNLMEELGHVVFGEEAIVLASETKQVVYIRCPGYSVGKILEATKANVWDAEQHLTIVSIRANTHLHHDFTWHQVITVRTSAEETRVEDILLYLPVCRKMAVVRPGEYYFRVVSVIDSEKVICNGSEFYWFPWLSSPNEKKVFEEEFPLLWSWECDQPDEDSAALRLVQTYHSAALGQADMEYAQDYSRAQALSEMAFLFCGWDDYEPACSRLSAMVNIYGSMCGPEAEVVTTENDRLSATTKRREQYVKAKSLLSGLFPPLSYNEKSCAHVIAHASMGLKFRAVPDQDFMFYLDFLNSYERNPNHVLGDLASKIMSQGVSKTMVLDAIELCTLDWEHIRHTATEHPYNDVFLSPFTHQRLSKLPRDNKLHSEYLGLLLQLCGDDILLTNEEVLEASHSFIGPWELNQLIKRCEARIDNFSDVLKALEGRRVGGGTSSDPAYRELGGDHVKGVLEGNADRVLITSESVLIAAKWHVSAVSAVLEAASDLSVITSTVLDTVLSDWQTVGPSAIEVLVRKMETEWVVSEDAFIDFLEAKSPIEVQVDRILVAILEENKVTINMTARILHAIVKHQKRILQFFHFRSDESLTKEVGRMLLYWRSNRWELPRGDIIERASPYLEALQSSLGPIDYEIVGSLSPRDELGYIHLLNLIHFRKNDATISEWMILKAVNHFDCDQLNDNFIRERVWKTGFAVEKFTSCLIKHADQEVIDALAKSSALRVAAAYRAYPRVIESLQSRLKKPQPDNKNLCNFAILCRSIEEDRYLRILNDKPVVRRDLVESFDTMSIPSDLQQVLLIRALNMQYEEERAEFLERLIESRVIAPGIPGELQEAILCEIIKRYDIAWKDFEMLLRHEIIGTDVVYENNRTPFHVLFGLNCREEGRVVDMLMQYGAIANVDVQGAEGRTPREIIHERIQEYDDPYRSSILARLDGENRRREEQWAN